MQFSGILISSFMAFAAADTNLWTCPCGEGQTLPEPCEGSTQVQFVQGCYKGKLDRCTKFADKNSGCQESDFLYFIASMDDNGDIITDVFADQDCTEATFSIPARNVCECSNNFGVSCDFFASPSKNSCRGIPDSDVCPSP